MKNDKSKVHDKTCTVRLTPIAVMQMKAMQEFTGENASRVMIRSLDKLFNDFVNQGAILPLTKIKKPKHHDQIANASKIKKTI